MTGNVMVEALAALIVCVMLLWQRSRPGDAASWRMIRRLMVCCAAVCLLDIPGLLLDGQTFPGARPLLWFLDTAYWLLHIFYCWLWLLFVDEQSYQSPHKQKRRAYLYGLPLLCEGAIVLTNPWTGWLFTLNHANVYASGTAYQLCLLPHYGYIVASLGIAFYGYRHGYSPEQKRRSLALVAYMFLPICGVAMEVFAYGVSWVWPMVALSLLMVCLNQQQQDIADEQLAAARADEAAARMETELANSRMSVMLSQIQPHFLYNALCVIQDLCHDKAPEAERATVAFSRFLRGNLDSLQENQPITFARELAHTRQYLMLEQMRFGPRLRVEYDLRTEDFRLPAMTLQPMVENAVRHGILKKEAGGTVRITTVETEDACILTVEDDGVGFDPAHKARDGRTHIGVQNVRLRLRQMCGGDLEIVSTRGAGTRATLRLPKGGATK